MRTTTYYRIRRIARVLTAVTLVVAAIAVVVVAIKLYLFSRGWWYAAEPYRDFAAMFIFADLGFGSAAFFKIVHWLSNVIYSLQEEE